MAQDRWQELLGQVAHDDGRPTRPCGPWTEEKLWIWNRYLEITTRAMVGSPHWPEGLVYVDLYGGPGICEVRDTKKRLPGSPLLAACAPKPFRKAVVVELDSNLAAACEARVRSAAPSLDIEFVLGDCNQVIDQIANRLPARALTLAFVDPEGFDLRFATLEALARDRRVDFFILFADAVDLVRNVGRYELEAQEKSKLSATFGSDAVWRPGWETLADRTGPAVREYFSKLFAERIREKLGYKGVREKVIRSPRGPLYRMIFASKHERGLEFFDKVNQRQIDGQQTLGLGW